ncbi:MAG: hypothetical protein KatS3mg102_2704 [Planctomycetota bacterium]|nr:MAG: hypothetical protein KatS3mg102_2704 [Planctomycetota bacterium]
MGHHGPGRPVTPDAPQALPPEAEPPLRAFLRETFPPLAEAALVGGRLCLYCDSFDGGPVDRPPSRAGRGWVVAAGGSGHGFKFAPVLGPLIADAVEGRPHAALDRLGWRARGAPRHEQARFTG